MKEAKDPYKALLNYRNTLLEGIGLSPAQLLMDRRLKISLPTHADLLKTRGAQEVKEHVQKRKPGKTRIMSRPLRFEQGDPETQVFSTLDAKEGFYQIGLDEEISKKTTLSIWQIHIFKNVIWY